MRYLIFVPAALFLVPSPAEAQEVHEIRTYYEDVQDLIESGTEVYMTETEINSLGAMYPATGTYGRSFDFHWRIVPDVYPSEQLMLVTVRSTYAAVEQYEEFLFGPSGDLLFYSSSGGYDMNELRLYFSGGYLQRSSEGDGSADRPDDHACAEGQRALLEAERLLQSFHLIH